MSKYKKFNVLVHKMGRVEHYDVLPYFRDCWKSKKYYQEEKEAIKNAKRDSTKRELLKEWIEDRSTYLFWAKCEYEFLIGSWPFGSYKMNNKLKEFITPEFNIDDYSQNVDFYNIIIDDMYKIDVHEQIMMNIDIITDILFDEFKLVK